jgi:RNA polymerase sigma factor (sigma-70 family)
MSIVHPPEPNDPAIFACAQSGCQECQERLIQRHMGLVHAVIQRRLATDLAYDDAEQEGRIALWKAIRYFDPGRGVAFSTYAWTVIQNRLWKANEYDWRRMKHWGAEEPSEEVIAPDGLEGLETRLWAEQVRQVLDEAFTRLNERQRQVIRLVYGFEVQTKLAEQTGGNLGDVGRHLGITGERVRQVRNDALVVLRLPVFSVRLRLLCEQDSREAYLRTRRLSHTWLRKRGRTLSGGRR